MSAMLWTSLALGLLGLWLLWSARRRQRGMGFPPGRWIQIDGRWLQRQEQALFDPSLGLTGRPDYLIRRGGRIIPVEAKSRRAPAQPYPSHLLQLAAYCRLVEVVYGARPPYGILKYADRSLALPYDAALENLLVETLRAMQRAAGQELHRSHQEARRCRHCPYRDPCEERLP
jgi:CRISPR-associated exonuclease Cas4